MEHAMFIPLSTQRFSSPASEFSPGPAPFLEWIETDKPGVIWHLVNAWEEQRADGGTNIVMFAPRYSDYPADIPIHTPDESHAYLTKWVLDIDNGTVLEDRVLLEWGYERPSFNTAFRGKPNRYAYLLDEQRQGYMGKGVLKYDLQEEREIKYFDYGAYFGGEALFGGERTDGQPITVATLTLAAMGARRIDVTWWGKAGTFANMFAFPLFLGSHSTVSYSTVCGFLAWVAAIPGLVLSYYALLLYVPIARQALREGRAAQTGGASNT